MKIAGGGNGRSADLVGDRQRFLRTHLPQDGGYEAGIESIARTNNIDDLWRAIARVGDHAPADQGHRPAFAPMGDHGLWSQTMRLDQRIHHAWLVEKLRVLLFAAEEDGDRWQQAANDLACRRQAPQLQPQIQVEADARPSLSRQRDGATHGFLAGLAESAGHPAELQHLDVREVVSVQIVGAEITCSRAPSVVEDSRPPAPTPTLPRTGRGAFVVFDVEPCWVVWIHYHLRGIDAFAADGFEDPFAERIGAHSADPAGRKPQARNRDGEV